MNRWLRPPWGQLANELGWRSPWTLHLCLQLASLFQLQQRWLKSIEELRARSVGIFTIELVVRSAVLNNRGWQVVWRWIHPLRQVIIMMWNHGLAIFYRSAINEALNFNSLMEKQPNPGRNQQKDTKHVNLKRNQGETTTSRFQTWLFERQVSHEYFIRRAERHSRQLEQIKIMWTNGLHPHARTISVVSKMRKILKLCTFLLQRRKVFFSFVSLRPLK